SHVPCSRTSPRARRCRRSQRERADDASNSIAETRSAPIRILEGFDDKRTPSASPSEGAGSVETINTRRPNAAAPRAQAAGQVVLPTPPLPPKNTNLGALTG